MNTRRDFLKKAALGGVMINLPDFMASAITVRKESNTTVSPDDELRFDIAKMPFSRYGSYIGVSARNEEGRIYIHCARRVFGEDKVFEIKFFVDGKPIKPEIDFQPHRLLFKSGTSHQAILYIKSENSLVIDSKNMDVQLEQFELPRKNGDTPEEYPLAYGTNVGNDYFKIISVNARFCSGIRLFEGTGNFKGPIRKNERGGEIDQRINLLLKSGNSRQLLAEVNIAPQEQQKNTFHRPDVEKDLAEIQESWKERLSRIPATAEKYRASAVRSWYNLWSSTVPAGGNYAYPAIVMSMEFMSSIWTWDHCFNALSASLHDVQHGLNQFFLPFEVQAPNGVLPDYINPNLEIVWGVTKPPIHGWCFSKLMDNNNLGKDVLAKAYKHLELWTNWWLNCNDTDEDGIPDYPMGCDSGWDNATVFDLGYFVESPDLSAFLVLQMNTLAKISDKLGNEQQAAEWKQKASALYGKFMEHSWTNSGLVAKVSQSHSYDKDPTSLITLIPLVLGEALESDKRKVMVEKLKKDFLTDYGLATEKYKGPYYKADNYWRGAVWAPSTYLIVDGLMRAGEKELALTIARRFCDMIAFVANGDFENFDALTGKGLRASGYTWTSSVNILLLKLLHDEN